MFKSVQVKIILIIMVLAILMFLSYGIYTIQELQNSNIQNEIINKNIFVFIIITAAFVGISIIVIWFTSRVITRPIYKLIKSAEKIAEGEELKIDNSKRNTEIDGLIQAFDTMTVGLNENLNKVTRQKKQIETILQYMTDGIMAFDLNGNIIHINSAAITLLGLTGPKNNFNEIFKSIDLDVNLEKIIYLEDWAKSERKIINVKDKYLKIFFASFKDELERPAGAIVLIQDITEHVRLDNMRKEFIADVSHELKTPLTSIM